MCFPYVRMDDDRDRARRDAAAFIGGAQAGDGSRFVEIIDRVAVVGTPDDIRRGFQSFIDAGARHLIVMPCGLEGSSELAARILNEIVPALEVPCVDR
jgi:alkanesulfonate monooxygenase SsuD/methylene tetrahydromethanopterin reductase-like flavin-dependent oxidoreductase (luciferase family)